MSLESTEKHFLGDGGWRVATEIRVGWIFVGVVAIKGGAEGERGFGDT